MTFTLPAGAQHAIRGQLRSVNEGPASDPCAVSGSIDHDDLVFAAVTVVAPDTTPPTTAITSPAAGATVAGTVAVTTASSDNVGVAAVELLLDGKVIATSVAAPWSFAWDTRATTNKSHTLRTRAR